MVKKVNCISLLTGLVFFVSCGEKTVKIKAQKLDLVESVYGSVTLEPSDFYYANVPVSGILKQIYVSEGDSVFEGSPLMQIDNSGAGYNTQNAKLSYDLAYENLKGNRSVLNDLKSKIKLATLKYRNDSINFIRQKNLKEKGIGSQNEFDLRKLAFESASLELSVLRNSYTQTQKQLDIQLKQAQNNLENAAKVSGDFTLKSILKGQVYEIRKKQGELIIPQEPLILIGSGKEFLIVLLIDEMDIAKVKVGQEVLVTLEAFGKEVFNAKISKIYPKLDSRSQTFKLEAVFEAPPLNLYPGLTGEANIVVAKKTKVLCIPGEYLIDGKKVNTPAGEKEVKTGLRNFEFVEILSGIDADTEIIKPN